MYITHIVYNNYYVMTVYLYVLSKSGGHDMGGAGRRRVVFCDRAIIILQVFKYVSISFSNIVTICVYMSITYIYIYIYSCTHTYIYIYVCGGAYTYLCYYK